MAPEWDSGLYDSSYSFVWEKGRDLVGLLSPQRGERVLDVGCGTAHLTAEIARSGAETLGVDSSASMIARARQNYPGLAFEIHDVCDLPYREEFDAVFSNAALHWVRRADDAARAIAAALRPGGRFVAEFGGHGNTRALLDAVSRALGAPTNPWYFPRIGEYAGILERHGLEVTFALLFDRPTTLEGGRDGIKTWMAMFGAPLTEHPTNPDFVARVEQFAAPALRRGDSWVVDYRRLRIVARKQSVTPSAG
jgi:SAM-dependent methyltransferase